MRSLKIVFYFTHKESLGHSSRVINIVQFLKRKYGGRASITVFQAGKEQEFLNLPEDVSWVHLPNPFHSKRDFKRGRSRYCIPLSVVDRARFMLGEIKRIKPDVFITEFFPFGREMSRFELLPVIQYCKIRKTRILASIGYPYIVQDNLKLLKMYSDFYDAFLIHTPKDIEYRSLLRCINNPVLNSLYRKIFQYLKDKIYYTGYIVPLYLQNKGSRKVSFKKQLGIDNKILVLVSRGGGVIYPGIIVEALYISKFLSDKYFIIIIAGPSASKKEFHLYKETIKRLGCKNIKLYRYLQEFPLLLKEADVSVSMCGYNTAVQLLYNGNKSVLIPSSVDPELANGYCCEQLSRAQILKKHLRSKILQYDSLKAPILAKAIQNVYKRNITEDAVSRDWFNGGERTADYIMKNAE